jgi:hypothetical protein
MIPAAVWQDYDPEAEPLEIMREESSVSKEIYRFTALSKGEEKVRVAVKVFLPVTDIAGVILIAHRYRSLPDEWVLNNLVGSGYMVVLPDLTGISDPSTYYPKSYEYGYIEKAGDHIKKVMPTARETCQYLYTILLRRTAVFLKEKFGCREYFLLGLGDAVEIAMQTAGLSNNVKGLACINGSGYSEYIRLNKYGARTELVMDDERMSWLSGVASVAYAKFINAPVFVAIGTNSTISDIDRLQNLKALLSTESFHTVYSPGTSDFIMPEAYASFKLWLKALSCGSPIAECPEIDLRANDDGSLYVDVHCDATSAIDSVYIYYSTGVYDHKLRCWQKVKGISIANGEYIAMPMIAEESVPFFAYAEVRYVSGLTLTSLIGYAELGELKVRAKKETDSRIVYQPMSETNGFIDGYSGEVLPRSGLTLVQLPSGAKGITSRYGSLKTYLRNVVNGLSADNLLHIDMCAEEAREVIVSVETIRGEGMRVYRAVVQLPSTKGLFYGVQLKLVDFKDEMRMPLQDWNICSLKIASNNVVIGNILFI